jgi:hypothetical protein
MEPEPAVHKRIRPEVTEQRQSRVQFLVARLAGKVVRSKDLESIESGLLSEERSIFRVAGAVLARYHDAAISPVGQVPREDRRLLTVTAIGQREAILARKQGGARHRDIRDLRVVDHVAQHQGVIRHPGRKHQRAPASDEVLISRYDVLGLSRRQPDDVHRNEFH